MLAALDDSDPNVRREVVKKIAKYDLKFSEIPLERVKQIGTFLKDENSKIREAAAKAVGNMGSKATELIPQLLELLRDEDFDVRYAAAMAVGNMGSKATELIPQLLELLGDENSKIREAAAKAVGNMGSKATELIPQLLELLRDEDFDVRYAAAMAMGNMGSKATELIPQLLELLRDKDWRVREAAATAIGNIGLEAKELIPWLRQLLRDEDWGVRSAAAIAIGNMGSEATELIPQLQQLLRDENSNVRSAAATAIGNMGSEAIELIPQLLQLFRDEDSLVRSAAVTAVGNLGSEATELIPKLQELLRDEDSLVRSTKDENSNVPYAAAIAISQIMLGDKESIPQWRQLFSDENSNVRYAAAIAVGNIGSEATKELIYKLVRSLKDEDLDVRYAAAKALGEMGSEAKELMFWLRPLLSDKDSNVRKAATRAAGEMGLEAQELIPKLLQLLSDDDSNVRKAAIMAVGNIEKEQLNIQQILQILNAAHRDGNTEATVRFLAYLFSGGESNTIILIKWLGSPEQYPYEDKYTNERSVSREEGKKVLELFAKIWEPSQSLEHLRLELKGQINIVVKNVDWQPEDITLLKTHDQNLDNENIKVKIAALQGTQWFYSSLISHLSRFSLLYLVLVCLFPFTLGLNFIIQVLKEFIKIYAEKGNNINLNIKVNSPMNDYQLKYDQRNSQNSFVDTAQSGSKQEFNPSMNQDNYTFLKEIIKIFAKNEKSNNTNIVEVNSNPTNRPMNDYQSKYDQRNSQNSFVDTAQSGSKQEFNPSMIHNNYTLEQKQTLAEAAEEIQQLLKQLESNNPAATDEEKVAFVSASIPPSNRQRFVGALQAGGKELFKGLLDNLYVNVGVAIVEGWQNPK
ncbi:MAG: hypothetical protein F6K40_17445 [Okeania sp. SIO3I5]|uniref:sister chromatid cohesion protein PDS5 n=1 Tax=Okeania sp. SIO3I5 TaxID=2607805 RepID=UPI0013B90265|nr:sister chromatid cohesion protein PDS5 [Okeania sp. SIO3I5]NEQ37950.1 hypothetical protein [Okeania sp. SIO3I5]